MICVYCGRTDLQYLNDYNRVTHLTACQKRLKEKEEREKAIPPIKSKKAIKEPVSTQSQAFRSLFCSNCSHVSII